MNRTQLSTFNQWLDAVVSGRSTPPSAASDSTIQEAISAARQLHELAWAADAASSRRSLPPTWEEFMHMHNLEASADVPRDLAGSPTDVLRRPGSSKVFSTANARPVRIASNILMAVIVLAVLLAGAWRATDNLRPGPPEEPATIPFGAFVQQEATPDTVSAVDMLAPATADQCTITPLTVGEVVAIVQDPWAVKTGQTPMASPSEITPPASPPTLDDLYLATPDIDPSAARPDEFATGEALVGVTATFHMFEACIEANSYFQVWATMDPMLVQESILAVLPPLTGEDDLRALLTDLETSGPGDPPDTVFWPLQFTVVSGSSLNTGRISRVVDQNPENTWMPEPHYLVAGYTSYDAEGTQIEEFATSIYDENHDGTPDPVIGYDPRLKQPSCFTVIFMWNDLRDMWLIQQYPVCG